MKQGLLKNKIFLLLTQGLGVSNIGNAIQITAVAWYILSSVGKTHSGFILSLYSLCLLVPIIITGPVAGVYVDRINRKLIIAGSDLICGILFLLLCLLTFFNVFPLPSLFIITILISFFFSFFNPAVNAVLPSIVHDDDLLRANSITQMTTQLSFVIGAAVSGLLYHKIGIIGVFFLNGISYVISGITEIFIDIPNFIKTSKEKTHILKDLLSGFIYVKNDKPILILFLYFFLFCFAARPFSTLLVPKIINYNLALDVSYFGYFNSSFAGGGIIGMLLIAYLSKKRINQYILFISSSITFTLIIISFAIPILPSIIENISPYNTIILYCIFGFMMMMLTSFIIIPIYSIFQKRIPNELLGRFFAIYYTCVLSATPIGSLMFGSLSDVIPEYSVVLIMGFFLLIITITLLKFPKLKELYSSL